MLCVSDVIGEEVIGDEDVVARRVRCEYAVVVCEIWDDEYVVKIFELGEYFY